MKQVGLLGVTILVVGMGVAGGALERGLSEAKGEVWESQCERSLHHLLTIQQEATQAKQELDSQEMALLFPTQFSNEDSGSHTGLFPHRYAQITNRLRAVLQRFEAGIQEFQQTCLAGHVKKASPRPKSGN
ncbi:MAG: hypothetical protein D6704_01905 [Nitrospirae bacterium]|nr:MAG: hypothetical protein D6704_01905 [Nitrospirota bacterium]